MTCNVYYQYKNASINLNLYTLKKHLPTAPEETDLINSSVADVRFTTNCLKFVMLENIDARKYRCCV